eukprot:15455937-Alexandrium_andersonii.AAC.1
MKRSLVYICTLEAMPTLLRLGTSTGRPSWLWSAQRSLGTHHMPGPGKMSFVALDSAWRASPLSP